MPRARPSSSRLCSVAWARLGQLRARASPGARPSLSSWPAVLPPRPRCFARPSASTGARSARARGVGRCRVSSFVA
eukprot:3053268-Alexandrium_andersonii.AAC.1